jgi:hypothetical protein
MNLNVCKTGFAVKEVLQMPLRWSAARLRDTHSLLCLSDMLQAYHEAKLQLYKLNPL